LVKAAADAAVSFAAVAVSCAFSLTFSAVSSAFSPQPITRASPNTNAIPDTQFKRFIIKPPHYLVDFFGDRHLPMRPYSLLTLLFVQVEI
jgi:hypothetical protein